MNKTIILYIALSAVASMLAVFSNYFRILKIAKDKALVDNPDARKLQKEPVPILGGIAVFIGLLVGICSGLLLMPHHVLPLLPVVITMTVMLYLGALDDINGLTPLTRIIVETFAVLVLIFGSGQCIDSLHGLWGIGTFSWWIAVPLTVFAGVGIINAINMIDGVNGLSSGLCITCCAMFGITFLQMGSVDDALLAFVMMASLVPFLLHNVFGKTSKMFIGDSGTMTLGIMLTWFVINMLDSHTKAINLDSRIGLVAMTLSILVIPIFDTLRVMFVRLLKGQNPFKADKTHLHHAFIDCGFSHSVTSLCEILLGICIYFLGMFSQFVFGFGPTGQLYVVIISGILIVWGGYLLLRRLSKHRRVAEYWLPKVTHLGHLPGRQCLQSMLDAPEQRMKDREEWRKKKNERKFVN